MMTSNNVDMTTRIRIRRRRSHPKPYVISIRCSEEVWKEWRNLLYELKKQNKDLTAEDLFKDMLEVYKAAVSGRGRII